MKITLALFFTIMTSLSFAHEEKERLPDLTPVVTKVCVEGTQYFYMAADRSTSLTPVIKDGKFLECQSDGQKCAKSKWDRSPTCL